MLDVALALLTIVYLYVVWLVSVPPEPESLFARGLFERPALANVSPAGPEYDMWATPLLVLTPTRP